MRGRNVFIYTSSSAKKKNSTNTREKLRLARPSTPFTPSQAGGPILAAFSLFVHADSGVVPHSCAWRVAHTASRCRHCPRKRTSSRPAPADGNTEGCLVVKGKQRGKRASLLPALTWGATRCVLHSLLRNQVDSAHAVNRHQRSFWVELCEGLQFLHTALRPCPCQTARWRAPTASDNCCAIVLVTIRTPPTTTPSPLLSLSLPNSASFLLGCCDPCAEFGRHGGRHLCLDKCSPFKNSRWVSCRHHDNRACGQRSVAPSKAPTLRFPSGEGSFSATQGTGRARWVILNS